MGGSFSGPKVQYVPYVDNSVAESKAAEEKTRQDALDRQRRGMEGTIRTSYNGILQADNGNDSFKRKKLLGE